MVGSIGLCRDRNRRPKVMKNEPKYRCAIRAWRSFATLFLTMQRKSTQILTALVLLFAALFAALPAVAQKKSSSKKTASQSAQAAFTPKSIQFKGAPEYSNLELLDAMDLKPGAPIVYSSLKAHSQKLLDTGFFPRPALLTAVPHWSLIWFLRARSIRCAWRICRSSPALNWTLHFISGYLSITAKFPLTAG